MGRRGNGIWNSCHRPLVSAETLLLTTTSWQHLKFPNLPKTLDFYYQIALIERLIEIMSSPTEKFVDAEDRVSLSQQKSAARCQQNGFIVGNTNALAANCIFAKMEKYLSNIDTGWQNLAAFRRGQKWPWKFSSSAYLHFLRQIRPFCAWLQICKFNSVKYAIYTM